MNPRRSSEKGDAATAALTNKVLGAPCRSAVSLTAGQIIRSSCRGAIKRFDQTIYSVCKSFGHHAPRHADALFSGQVDELAATSAATQTQVAAVLGRLEECMAQMAADKAEVLAKLGESLV